jgi:hypothetical protein
MEPEFATSPNPAPPDPAFEPAPAPKLARPTWRVFLILLAAALVGELAIIPFSIELLDQGDTMAKIPMDRNLFLIIAFTVQIVLDLGLTVFALLAGRHLGPRLGLGASDLEQLVAGDPEASRRVRNALPVAVVAGILSGIAIVVLANVLPVASTKEIVHPGWWESLLASLSAGIREELWLRFGLLTLFAWAGTRLLRQNTLSPGVFWTANLLATLLFGALHLPQAAGLIGLSARVVFYVLLLNGIAGLVFGWLYARKGLLAAMVSHFVADIVLHVIYPAVKG